MEGIFKKLISFCSKAADDVKAYFKFQSCDFNTFRVGSYSSIDYWMSFCTYGEYIVACQRDGVSSNTGFSSYTTY